MKKKFTIRKVIVALVIIVIIFNIVLLTPLQNGVSSSVNFIITPVSNAARGVSGFFANFQNNGKLNEDNTRIAGENDYLRQENERLQAREEELEVQNKNLKEELDIRDGDKYQYLTATVTYRTLNSLDDKININKGKNDGIQENQLVLNKGICIGYIGNVKDSESEVVLFSSQNVIFNLPVKVLHNGKGYDATLEKYVPQEKKIGIKPLVYQEVFSVGDKVYTNGFGENQPGNVYIGEISKMSGEGVNSEYYLSTRNESFENLEVIIDENKK